MNRLYAFAYYELFRNFSRSNPGREMTGFRFTSGLSSPGTVWQGIAHFVHFMSECPKKRLLRQLSRAISLNYFYAISPRIFTLCPYSCTICISCARCDGYGKLRVYAAGSCRSLACTAENSRRLCRNTDSLLSRIRNLSPRPVPGRIL